MNLDEFLYKLHYETDQITPPDWQVNWEDAPLPYKLYEGLPVIHLDSGLPVSFSQKNKPTLTDLSHFLSYSYRITQVSQTFPSMETSESWTTYRRFVPSGGALYPNELYLYVRLEDFPTGIYHYDAAHHRLVCLREGNFDSYLERSLGERCDITSCFAAVFVSTFFWKNFFKYNNFSYRLQSLDAGFLIGQMLEVGKRNGFETCVYYHFLDSAINHLLGLNESEESVYAIMPLAKDQNMKWFDTIADQSLTTEQLSSELKSLHHKHYVRSKEIRPYHMLLNLNSACKLRSFSSINVYNEDVQKDVDGPVLTLPLVEPLTYPFNTACEKRYSPGLDFALKPLTTEPLAYLLNETAATSFYRNDLDQNKKSLTSRISIRFATNSVVGLQNGMYEMDSSCFQLKQIKLGDFRTALQDGLLSDFVNMPQIPLSFNISGSKDHYRKMFGYRGHRIQHMEVGILSHKLLLAASALHMNGHPILGFDVPYYDELFNLQQMGRTSLLQIPIGYYRPHPRLQGHLHS
ncbi:SagB family peptide dehydrogenase [Fictibacillus phosphorivorans]|uniref:SagB family peptide dehydrogenase n=1 Tax=Fictibacillus phosphorivorans TaxID=1221500 RepID=UPI0011A5B21D|nr:SagB family peptide dehydrogenase [Fictibacillus phosphorivorans]